MTEEQAKPVANAPFTHHNWKAFDSGSPRMGIEEYPLFTDTWFEGEIRGLGPYDILWALAFEPSGRARPAFTLRAAIHADPACGGGKGIKTDVTHYHGGPPQQEVAALLSLCSGTRFKAGGLSREFKDGGDPLGTPRGFGGSWGFMRPERGLRVPRATRRVHLNEDCEQRLRTFSSLNEQDASALVRAARLYQDALWVAESEPHLSWIFLVSAIEAVADCWRKSNSSPVERLALHRPESILLLREKGGDELVEQVAQMFADFMGATRKFVDFMLAHKPGPPMGERIADRVSWDDEELTKSLKLIYQWRSKALHGGVPFPAPMSDPPFEAKDGVFSEKPLGLAQHMLGATWDAQDTPMLLHVFEHLVRGALLRWWSSKSNTDGPVAAGSSL